MRCFNLKKSPLVRSQPFSTEYPFLGRLTRKTVIYDEHEKLGGYVLFLEKYKMPARLNHILGSVPTISKSDLGPSPAGEVEP